jgi:predicted DNA-binding transcriptional regulator AlpA
MVGRQTLPSSDGPGSLGLRMVKLDAKEAMGLTELAKELGVARNTVWRWSQLPDFPAPWTTLSAGSVWDRRKVRAWVKARQRKTA